MATATATSSSALKVREFVSTFQAVSDSKTRNKIGQAAEFGIYQVIGNLQKEDKDCPYNPFPVNKWQSYDNLISAKPKVVQDVKTRIPKYKTEGKKKVRDGWEDGFPKLKKITSVGRSFKDDVCFMIAAVANEANVAAPAVAKLENKSRDAVKGELVKAAIDMQNTNAPYPAVSPLLFDLADRLNTRVIKDSIDTQKGLNNTVAEALLTHVSGGETRDMIGDALNTVVKGFCIYRANQLWQKSKDAGEDINGEEKEKRAAAAKAAKASGETKTAEKKTKTKKAPKPLGDDDEIEIEGVSANTSGVQFREYLGTMYALLVEAKLRVKINEIFIAMDTYGRCHEAVEAERKAKHKADTKTGEKIVTAETKATETKAPAPAAEAKTAAAAPATAAATPATPAPAAGVAVAAAPEPAAAAATTRGGRRRG